ncbi:hypothetical protein X963_5519 [Burkholderia pseudomallei MSHR7498]|nr:hypothetical protein X963_5519 [Burkholderia pseudomallei MSHR7498]
MPSCRASRDERATSAATRRETAPVSCRKTIPCVRRAGSQWAGSGRGAAPWRRRCRRQARRSRRIERVAAHRRDDARRRHATRCSGTHALGSAVIQSLADRRRTDTGRRRASLFRQIENPRHRRPFDAGGRPRRRLLERAHQRLPFDDLRVGTRVGIETRRVEASVVGIHHHRHPRAEPVDLHRHDAVRAKIRGDLRPDPLVMRFVARDRIRVVLQVQGQAVSHRALRGSSCVKPRQVSARSRCV